MTLAHRALRGIVIVLFSSYANMGLGILYGIGMARLLEPEHFGVFAGAMFVFTLLDLRGKLGLDYAFIHRQPAPDTLIATHWILQVSAASFSAILIALVSVLLSVFGYPVGTWVIATVIAGVMLIESAGATARAALEKELAFAWSSTVVTGALLLSYISALVMAFQGFGYWALVGQVAVNAIAGSLGFWWAYKRTAHQLDVKFVFDAGVAIWLLKFGATMAIGAVATAILLQFDNFLVLTLAGSAAAGYYVQAYKVAQWPTGLVTHVIARASLPTYARLQHDLARLSKAFELSLWAILTLAVPMALALFVVAPDFLLLLYGPKWLPSAMLLRFLIGYSVLRPLLDDTGALFTALGQPQRISLVLSVQAITLVGIATPLTFQFGALGTAIGVGVTFGVGILLTYHLVSRSLTLPLVHIFWPPAMASAVSLALYWGVTQLINLNDFPLVVRVLTKGSLVALPFLLVTFVLEGRALAGRVNYLWRIMRSPQG